MPNLRKNPCFLRIFMACFSLREKKGFMAESTDLFLLGSATTPPPPDFRLEVFRARRVELFRLLPEISGYFGIPIGQP